MSQTFLGIFLIILGVIGIIVGAVTGHLTNSALDFIIHLLPVVLGAVMIAVDRAGGKKK